MSDVPEPDRLDDTPHPRETATLIGHTAAERALLDAYRSGTIHHGWILGGPEGIGKATLAYRMAKFVLANPDPGTIQGATSLSTDAEASVVRQVVAQSHLDLMVLRRVCVPERKAVSADIRVEDVRRLRAFFGSTAAAGGWRIAIVDAADDLNTAGANALLKVLEEPPPRVLFLIVSHQPGRLLPTIRSRCRRLQLSRLGDDDTITAAQLARTDLSAEEIRVSASLSQGSVRRTIALAAGEGMAVHKEVSGLLDALPILDVAAVHKLAERCANKAGDETFGLVLGFLEDWLHARLTADREGGLARLARWAEVWEKAAQSVREVEIYNLDRRPFILATFSQLAAASRP